MGRGGVENCPKLRDVINGRPQTMSKSKKMCLRNCNPKNFTLKTFHFPSSELWREYSFRSNRQNLSQNVSIPLLHTHTHTQTHTHAYKHTQSVTKAGITCHIWHCVVVFSPSPWLRFEKSQCCEKNNKNVFSRFFAWITFRQSTTHWDGSGR